MSISTPNQRIMTALVAEGLLTQSRRDSEAQGSSVNPQAPLFLALAVTRKNTANEATSARTA